MARVYVSSVINAPASDVWDRVRDFNGLPKWHPRIRDSRIEDALPADKVGCIRNFHLQNGELIREQLLGLSDYDMFCTYSILESPMPLEDYLATLRLTPITEGDRTFIEWTAEFSCAPSDEDGLVEGIGMDVFQAGFESLKRHFGSN
ncbi:MAG: SRPBCC family protein [Pseudomonadota bacterium]